jgi:hypothetical protein
LEDIAEKVACARRCPLFYHGTFGSNLVFRRLQQSR